MYFVYIAYPSLGIVTLLIRTEEKDAVPVLVSPLAFTRAALTISDGGYITVVFYECYNVRLFSRTRNYCLLT